MEKDPHVEVKFKEEEQLESPQESGEEVLLGKEQVILKEITSEEKQWGMFIHFSSFIGYFTGIGFLLAPLILWLVKKDKNSEFLDLNGKEAVNFQISMIIYWLVAWLLMFVLVGFLLVPVLGIGQFVLALIAGIKANEGKIYRYPLTIRFIK